MSVYNTKGGVGKTNMAVNISTACSMLGKKVAIIDTEENGTSSYVLGKEERNKFLNSVKDNLESKLDLLSAENITRIKYENKIKAVEGSLALDCFYCNIEKSTSNDALLSLLIDLDSKEYDLVVIDLPGKNIDNIKQIVNIADIVLIPHRNTNLDFAGAIKSLENIEDLSKCKRVIWNERFGSIEEFENSVEEIKILEDVVKSLNTKVKSSKSYDRSMNFGLGVAEMHEFLNEESKELFKLPKQINKAYFKSSRDIIMSIIKELNI
jgi:cellulose biosynthesis protein BcsQ